VSKDYLFNQRQDYESNPDQESESKTAFDSQRDDWIHFAGELADWAMQRLVVRPDAYFAYYKTPTGKADGAKADKPVTIDLLKSHFSAVTTAGLIGLYTTSIDDRCKSLTIDLDRHDDDKHEVAVRNTTFAQHLHDQLKELGFEPLLIDSNGMGGFHIQVVFAQPILAKQVRTFGRWLVRGWSDFGYAREPEVFPKQDSIQGGYGHSVRLPGLHHSRQHYSRIWDGERWLAGHEAIKAILGTSGDSFELVPEEARNWIPPADSIEKSEWWQKYDGDLRTLDVVELFRSRQLPTDEVNEQEYEVTCPWADEHTTGSDTARVQLPDEDEGRFPAFNCFHQHCSHRGLPELLDYFGKKAVDQHCRKRFGESDTSGPIISPSDQLNVARQFYSDQFGHETDPTLFHVEGRWMRWNGRTYRESKDDDLRARLWLWLDGCLFRPNTKKGKKGKLKEICPIEATYRASLTP
jgi:hypothetical protein